jgi:hypothetical protein
MPQLSIETFVTQYFWLVVLMLVLYYINVTIIIPRISLIIKSREITSWLSGTTLSLTEIKKAPEYKRVTYNRRENKTTWEV